MTTAAEIVADSLQEILVQASESPIEANEAQSFIRAMNRFALALDAQNITLGYTIITDLGDTVTIPAGAEEAFVKNMAVRMAPSFGAIVPPELAMQANEGMKTLAILGFSIGPSRMPNTMPTGSGNEGSGSFCGRRFFPSTGDQIAAETNGNIALETNTNTVAEE